MDWTTLIALFFFATSWLIRLTMLLVVPQRRSSGVATAWLLLIFIFPWLGLLLYLALGSNRFARERCRRHERFVEVVADRSRDLHRNPAMAPPELPPDLLPSAVLAQNLGRMPVFGGNTVELLSDYYETIDRMIADIDSAKHHVHLVTYLFADDTTGGRVVDALIRARQRGVECRVLADAVGSGRNLRTLIPKLRSHGIEAQAALPLGVFRQTTSRFDLRNHRKITLIDGHIAYTGSQNIVDATFKPGITYEELMVRVTGPVVWQLQVTFIGDWYFETGKLKGESAYFPGPFVTGEVAIQALPSGPGYTVSNNQRLFVNLLHRASERVVLTTPYFIPDEAFLQALETATARGVDVHLVVSAQADQFLVSHAQRSYYEQLLEWGVVVHLYHRAFLHAKHISVDKDIAIIGSSNMDIRSFLLDDEISLLIYDKEVNTRLRAQEEYYFAHAEQLCLEQWRQRPLKDRVLQSSTRLVGPLL